MFFEIYGDKLFIDEFQRVPSILINIKKIVDSKKENGQFWLSGSQKFVMMKNVSESLAGRVAIFDMLPYIFALNKICIKELAQICNPLRLIMYEYLKMVGYLFFFFHLFSHGTVLFRKTSRYSRFMVSISAGVISSGVNRFLWQSFSRFRYERPGRSLCTSSSILYLLEQELPVRK